jgi:hypothetical protein
MINTLSWHYLAKNLLPFVFVCVNVFALYALSSVNRETEVANYIAAHEKNYLEIIKAYDVNHNNSFIDSALNHVNVCGLYEKDDEYHFGLYAFSGYGYRILFTEKPDMKKPSSIGGSPVMKWFKIKEHWYYYSYFD